MEKKLLITGASGFIGRHVVSCAAQAGWKVYTLDKVLDSDLSVEKWILDDLATCQPAMWGVKFDCCIHLAWPLPPQAYAESLENFLALHASAIFITKLVEAGCENFVVAGSCAEYNYAQHSWPVKEDGDIGPSTPYGLCKDTLHHYCNMLAATKGIRVSWGRIFQLYGEGEAHGRLLPSLVRAWQVHEPFYAASCKQVRDYLHVADVASGLICLAEYGKQGAYNICSGKATRLDTLMQEFAKNYQGYSEIKFGTKEESKGWNPEKMWGDNGKLRNLGWSVNVALGSGLQGYANSLKLKDF